MDFFARRAFAVTNFASLGMYFGMFGSIFFLSQFMQTVLRNSPLQAGLKLLVWTGATMIVAPIAGVFSQRVGQPSADARRARAAGGRARVARGVPPRRTAYTQHARALRDGRRRHGARVRALGERRALRVRTDQAGQASGATNAIREIGGVLGVAVLASVFTSAGGYASPHAFVAGLVPALWVGAAVVGLAGLVVLLVPFSTRVASAPETTQDAIVPARTARPLLAGGARPAVEAS